MWDEAGRVGLALEFMAEIDCSASLASEYPWTIRLASCTRRIGRLSLKAVLSAAEIGYTCKMKTRYLVYSSQKPSLLRKIAAIAVLTVTAVAAVMFSAVLLALLLCVAIVAGIYLWWKTRALRRQMREMQVAETEACAMQEDDAGIVIEGEAVRVDAKRDTP